MKKICAIFLSSLFLFSLVGCAKTYHGTEELLEKAREEFPIAEAETAEIRYAGMCGKENKVLCWFVSGNEYQVHTYLPMEADVLGKDAYRFVHTYKPIMRAEDIAVLLWQRGTAFLINHPDCAEVKITDENGVHFEKIEKDALPYVFYWPTIATEYVFLDAEGNVLES